MVNRQRLADTFKKLVSIDSISREEGAIAKELQSILEQLGAQVQIDDAAEKVGGETGNLIAKFKGDAAAPPLLLNAHMDTVEPGRGIVPVFKDGVFTSQGDTILGADDKSAIAIILEVLTLIKENGLPHAPLDVVFTVCEEVGLLGAKHLDFDLISATYGFAIDAADTRGIVTRAPSANYLEFAIHGKSAHAGAKPEKGINAIHIASKAIANLKLGRIDHETTSNIGIIEGGLATNIVPDFVRVKGEVRSHDEEKLRQVTDGMIAIFQETVETNVGEYPDENLPKLTHKTEKEFARTNLPEDHRVVMLAMNAAANLERTMTCKTTGGGADANVFFQHGIDMGVLGTGMKDMHTNQESIRLDDMVDTTELLVEIVRLHSQEISS